MMRRTWFAMNMSRLMLALVIGALLSSCQRENFLVGPNDHDTKTKDIYDSISKVYDRLTYGTQENPCLAIGTPQPETCFYSMTILKEKDAKDFYLGRFSDRACEQNRRSGNPFEKCDFDHWKPAPHMFKVNGNPNLVRGKDYDLYSQPDSDELTCHDPNTPAGSPTTNCSERMTDIEPVPTN